MTQQDEKQWQVVARIQKMYANLREFMPCGWDDGYSNDIRVEIFWQKCHNPVIRMSIGPIASDQDDSYGYPDTLSWALVALESAVKKTVERRMKEMSEIIK